MKTKFKNAALKSYYNLVVDAYESMGMEANTVVVTTLITATLTVVVLGSRNLAWAVIAMICVMALCSVFIYFGFVFAIKSMQTIEHACDEVEEDYINTLSKKKEYENHLCDTIEELHDKYDALKIENENLKYDNNKLMLELYNKVKKED